VDRFPALSGRELVRLLGKAGFRVVSRRGSHTKLRRGEVTVIVSGHSNQPLKRRTMMGMLKDAGLTLEEAWEFLRR
jgi:predicted RNA binding protein YcfA (HicA-like mRNA interferase family)